MRRAESVTLRRNAEGWSVEADGTPVDSTHDLLLAMTVADLLIDELQPKRRPVVVASDDTELDRLRTVVAQLEHALSARIVVERAIGVLSERLGLTPTEAFGRLRSTARSGGRRVHDLATDVVASVTSDVKLPPSLS